MSVTTLNGRRAAEGGEVGCVVVRADEGHTLRLPRPNVSWLCAPAAHCHVLEYARARAMRTRSAACNAPAEEPQRKPLGGLKRVSSEALLREKAAALQSAATLVRSESGRHLAMHLQMIASGALPAVARTSALHCALTC